ncbi:MAG: DUF721 domain-containing protein [Saprospiraceae bacterium]|nr:DUF721 domain-containing protein [Saprospiraceae bacterium]
MKKNERTLKEVLGDFLHSPKIRDKYYQVSIEAAWRKHLGATIASYTTDFRFRKGRLSVNVNSAPLREELNTGRDKLVQLLNEALDDPVIHEIKIY